MPRATVPTPTHCDSRSRLGTTFNNTAIKKTPESSGQSAIKMKYNIDDLLYSNDSRIFYVLIKGMKNQRYECDFLDRNLNIEGERRSYSIDTIDEYYFRSEEHTSELQSH